MRILQINSIVNLESTGRIAEDIGKVLIANGHESYIAYGRSNRPSQSKLIKIGNKYDFYQHAVLTRLTDRHGFGSKQATLNLIKEIETIRPNAIGLHNIHGYYINIEVLFDYLAEKEIPVLWTLFDCWSFTGHCAYFDKIGCEKWLTKCHHCPQIRNYPASFYIDNSERNFADKKNIFNSLPKMELIAHSHWLSGLVSKSFLNKIPIHTIPSGIDLSLFKPIQSEIKERMGIEHSKKIVLGVASPWSKRKGLDDFHLLRQQLSDDYTIVLVGLTAKQKKALQPNMIGIERTDSVQELAELYSVADVFVNPTYQDNFPTTNIESLACGTPVITYNTGGSPEAIDKDTGFVVEKGDIKGLVAAVANVIKKGKEHYQPLCRTRAENCFNKDERYLEYLNLYEQLMKR